MRRATARFGPCASLDARTFVAQHSVRPLWCAGLFCFLSLCAGGSEGGHVDFAPRDQLEFGLLEYVKKSERVTRVSVERIVSGLGIPKIYEYFAHLYPAEVSAAVTEQLRIEDPGAVIARYAESGECNLCKQTIELFVRCYGAEAGNLALKMLPFGGTHTN